MRFILSLQFIYDCWCIFKSNNFILFDYCSPSPQNRYFGCHFFTTSSINANIFHNIFYIFSKSVQLLSQKFQPIQKKLRNLLPEITKISHILKCHWPLFQHCGLSSCTIKLMGFLIRAKKEKPERERSE